MNSTYNHFRETIRDMYFFMDDREYDKQLYAFVLKCIAYERKKAIQLLEEYKHSAYCHVKNIERVENIIQFLQEKVED